MNCEALGCITIDKNMFFIKRILKKIVFVKMKLVGE